jgi:hypothetical protein
MAVFLTPQIVVVNQANAATTTLPPKYPTQDAIWDASGVTSDIDTDYVGYSGDATFAKQRSAIQFNLSDVVENIQKATLRIYINDWQDGDTTDATVPTVKLVGSTADAWDTVSTNSVFPMNAGDAIIDTVNVPGSNASSGQWLEFDVTNFVKSQMSLDKIMTFALIGEENKVSTQFGFASDNNADATKRPQLVLEAAPAPALQPVAADATTLEDTPVDAITITPNPADTNPVTHYKITGITGGTLYKNNGTTKINNDDFILASEGAAGLKFIPNADANSDEGGTFFFHVQAAQDNIGTGLSTPKQVFVTVNQVNDAPTATGEALPIILDENSSAHSIPFSDLTANDAKGPAGHENSQALTVDWVGDVVGGSVDIQGGNVVFTPNTDYYGTASFAYTVQDNGLTNGASDPKSSAKATATFAINRVAKTPIVTGATTQEDTPTANGQLKITPNAADAGAVTHYKITGITGGTLSKNDGTAISNNQFITTAEGLAGLKFNPDADANTPAGDTFAFQVQAALDSAGKGLSTAVSAVITVDEVNDAPTAQSEALSPVSEDSGDRTIPFADLLAHASAGPANESGQHLTISSVTGGTGGTVRLDGSNVIFTPQSDFNGTASFQFTVTDNGTTSGAANPKSVTQTATFPIQPVADIPNVTLGVAEEDHFSTDDGLVITRNAADGAEVTRFKIGNITGGRLYQHNATTEIHDGEFITIADGLAGLKFTPDADANSSSPKEFSFEVQAALNGTETGISAPATATVKVTEVNDAPTAVADALSPVQEDADEIAIPFDRLTGNDSAGPNESNQTLTISSVSNATGGQVRFDKDTKTVFFKPNANFNGNAHFDYTVEDDGTTNATPAPLTATSTVTIPVNSVADTPNVTDGSTTEDEPTTDGLFLTRNVADEVDVAYFKITDIHGGKLYKNDAVTEIAEGAFIPVADGQSGLKFTPAKDANSPAGDSFTFNVQASLDTAGTGLSGSKQAKITVTEVNDAPVAVNDALTSVPENSGARTIPLEDLTANDAVGPVDEKKGQHLTVKSVSNQAGGTAEIVGDHVVFTPEHDFHGTASFDYTVEDDGTTNNVLDKRTNTATVWFTIEARADEPNVSNAITPEDTTTSSDLVITPTAAGGATTTHFKISGITGGTLNHNDGTPIADGEYITVAEGGAGLKFTPDADAHGTTGFGFDVQAAPGTDGTLLSDVVHASIIVTEVNDDPIAQDDHLDKVTTGTAEVSIPVSALTVNDSAGPADEQASQTLSATTVTSGVGGTVTLVGEYVKFVPEENFKGLAKFTYTVSDNGRTNGTDAPKEATAEVSFNIVDEDQPVITLYGDADVYVLKGQPYGEPGYAADDRTDHDLTNSVMVTGAVNTDELGTYQLHYNVADTSGNAAPEVVRTVHVVSNDLAALSVASGTLTPAFDPAQGEYTLKVPTNTSKLTIDASSIDPTATVTIGGESAGNGGSQTVKLKVGKNDVTIVVTAQGGAKKYYHLEITRPPGSPSGGGGGGSDVRHGDVHTGNGNGPVVQVDISRTTGSNGHIVDSVIMNAAKADEVVRQAATDGGKIARIVIDDVPGKPADEVTVNVSGAALAKMKSAKLGLVIEAGGSKITLSADTLSQMGQNGEDLYFHVVPIRQPEARHQVEQRVANSKVIKDYARGGNVTLVGQPMTIDTNYSSRRTKVLLPLSGMNLPSDAKERAAFLNSLAVFVEHSDGEKLVQTGTLVYDAAGEPTGLEIEVQKFSTFTVISADVQYQTYARYISGYPDGTFHPSANITRAELASILARQLKLDAGSAASAQRYPDVSDSHWAWAAIEELRAAGILIGDAQGQFRPDQPVTRAELAIIAARLKHLDTTGTLPNFQDATGHWAAASIAAVKQTGLMNGYEDGTFRPNQSLTRAEAVAVINRLFERPALKNAPQASWPDVLLTEWYAPDVESASHDLRKYSDGWIDVAGNN